MEGVLAREAAAKGMTRDQVYDGYASGTSMRSFVEARDVANMAVFLGMDVSRLVWSVKAVKQQIDPASELNPTSDATRQAPNTRLISPRSRQINQTAMIAV